jgi:NodT family efflux transporter outer membrane factor (OMF) lipoprotein
MTDHRLELTGTLLVVLVVAACSGTKYADDTDEVVEMPDAYKETGVEGEPLDRWCSDFEAPQLASLVDRAFEGNMNLRQGWARLKQASAAARQAGAARWPTVTAEGSVRRVEQPSIPVEIQNTQINASVGASYEVDLWGRMANLHQAAKFDRRAARADVEAMAMSLTTQIAENWFNLVHQRARVDLLESQYDISERFLELTLVRLARGTATALDVNQQRQQLQSLEGQLETARAQKETAKHQLAVLLGKTPQTDVTGDRRELPEVPERPGTGVPADLLQRRPDIRAEMLRLEAADKRTAAAVKSQYPSLRLSANVFSQASNLDQFFEEFFWDAMAAASQPLFDGGRRFAEIDSAESRAEAQLYAYGQAVLEALREVEDALALEEGQKGLIESLREQVDTSEQALQLARERYQRGAADYLRVLTSLQSLQSVEQSLLNARRQRLSHRVQLCRALGGTWTEELEDPTREDSDEDGADEENGSPATRGSSSEQSTGNTGGESRSDNESTSDRSGDASNDPEPESTEQTTDN